MQDKEETTIFIEFAADQSSPFERGSHDALSIKKGKIIIAGQCPVESSNHSVQSISVCVCPSE